MLTYRIANESDLMLYFEWANDIEVREQSFNENIISLEEHTKWFFEKINDINSVLLVFENELHQPVGQTRFQVINDTENVIGISVSKEHRGYGYASQILIQSSDYFLKKYPNRKIIAYIKETNIASINSFNKAGFIFIDNLVYLDHKAVMYIKKN